MAVYLARRLLHVLLLFYCLMSLNYRDDTTSMKLKRKWKVSQTASISNATYFSNSCMCIPPTYQQNHRMMTPRAASETVSSPPWTGYIQSQKPLHECETGNDWKQ